ncbi:uncharacterized protein LOC114518414 [Dendronephthya gigantea]|uniref:uncharacterized protein LOC114518414 n=1 Tax=Dendronephthya gigantea TaxID=151771 RepID=UPI00106C5601|nr:uncharacterized protein LOC114518414 [Dendronephthya gigantea]
MKLDANIAFNWTKIKEILESDQCSGEVIAYYKFDRSFRDVCFGHNAHKERNVVRDISEGIANSAARFYDHYKISYLYVPSLYGYEWGSTFSVSIWFKNVEIVRDEIRGLINNGPAAIQKQNQHKSFRRSPTTPNTLGSWQIRIASQKFIGASIVTSHSAKTWQNITTAISDHWHHFVMTYDGSTISFYHNSHLKLTDSSCYGNILSKNSQVVMGHTKTRARNGSGEMKDVYFNGYMDEVILFKKALTAKQVTRLYQLKVV